VLRLETKGGEKGQEAGGSFMTKKYSPDMVGCIHREEGMGRVVKERKRANIVMGEESCICMTR